MVRLSGFIESGEYRQIHQPGELQYGLFSAKGAQILNDWIVTGSIDLSRGAGAEQHYNARAPRQSYNPYQWVDTTGGDWTNNLVSLSGALGSPLLFGTLSLGLAATYDVMQGARQNNERPLFNYSRYRLTAGISHEAGSNEAGISFTYSNNSEEQELGFFNQLDTFVLILRGIGTFNQTSFNSASRTYDGVSRGANAQFTRKSESDLWSFSAGYTFFAEDVSTGIARPVPNGLWELHTIGSSNTYRRSSGRSYHEFNLDGDFKVGRGTDPQLNGINAELTATGFGLSYRYADASRFRSLGIAANIRQYDMNDIVSQASESFTLINLETHASRPLLFPGLQLNAELGLQLPANYSLSFRNQNEVIRRIFLPQSDYIDQTVFSSGLHLHYTWNLNSYRLAAGARIKQHFAPGATGSFTDKNRNFLGLHITILY
ncbi:MAG: hypothetical protein LAT84_12720 [Balneolia bacterium]|nr:hypothetical protein [Balneolia bacterium]